MKNYLRNGAILALVLFVFAGCKKDKEETIIEPLNTKSIVIDAKAYDKWVYLNLSSGKIVTPEDYKNDMSWDVAFHRDNVRTNGGASGIGKGAGLEIEVKSLAEVTEAPENGYVKDEITDIMTAYIMPPQYEKQPANAELEKWGNFDLSEMPPVFVLSENVYVMKTAEGKYAKLKFTDYYNENGESGFIELKYVIQEDGSRNLK